MARERTPYFKRYPKIVRAKRIVLPIAIGVMLVCLVTAINNPGSFWWRDARYWRHALGWFAHGPSH